MPDRIPDPRRPVDLNAAGAARPLAEAQDAMADCLAREADGTPHWAASAFGPQIAAGRSAASRLLGAASAAHVAFGVTATGLWASLFGALALRRGARVILGRGEWGGNAINAIRRARQQGADIEIAPTDPSGRVDVAALAASIDDRVAAICLPVACNAFGVAQPVPEVGAIPRPADCLFFVDAAQAAGRSPVDLRRWNADVVTTPARKWLRGPRGQAVAALSDRALSTLGDPPLLDLSGVAHRDARRFETFEHAVAARVGFAVAIAHAEAALPDIRRTIDGKVAALRDGLAQAGIPVFEGTGAPPAFLTFAIPGESPPCTVERLRRAGIAIGCAHRDGACFELAARGLEAVCRVSPHVYATAAELERFVDAVRVRVVA